MGALSVQMGDRRPTEANLGILWRPGLIHIAVAVKQRHRQPPVAGRMEKVQ